MTRPVPRLHAPTDDRVLARPDFLERARALIKAGVAVHLRSGTASARALFDLANQLPGCWINDRVDIAKLVGAPGVHLPEAGLDTAAARAILGKVVIGRSAHTAKSATAALAGGADYAMLGPIWTTPSHTGRAPLGLEAVRAAGVGRVIVVGGVTEARVAEAQAAGAYGVAAVSALWDAPDPRATARAMLLLLEQ